MTPAEALASAIKLATQGVVASGELSPNEAKTMAHILAALAAAGWVVVPADQASVEWRKGYGKGYGEGYAAAKSVSEIGRSP